MIDKSYAPSWGQKWQKSLAERDEIFSKLGKDLGDTVELTENVAFKSPNHAGGFATGHNVNAWVTWKDQNSKCKTDPKTGLPVRRVIVGGSGLVTHGASILSMKVPRSKR